LSHSKFEALNGYASFSRGLAAKIPQARFVGLPGGNHMIQDADPGIEPLIEATTDFIREHAV
jgi:hypothetical protein